MKYKWILPMTGVLLFIGCATVPITGRKQLNLANEGEMMALANTAYGSFLEENQALPPNDPSTIQVRTVGEKLAVAATKFLNENDASNRVANYEWRFNVVNDPTVNAWCMPGGKVVVYTGILPVTQDDAGLAVVMGHEIAHAIARHGNERMSEGMTLQFGGALLETAMGENPTVVKNIFLQSVGIGSQLGMLKFSRNHETEADKMGLVFMAMAGYDPREAPKFWERMSANGGAAPPEFLSTHPSDATRIEGLNNYMPQALKYYKPAQN